MRYSWLGLIAFFVVTMIRANQKQKQMVKHSIESTMVSLVKSTQTGMLATMDWMVDVSDDMRARLYYPLTHDQVHTISTTQERPQVNRFDCRCLGHERKKNTITGTVEVSLDYVNEANGLDLHFKDVLINMEWTFVQHRGWYVSSVQYN